MEFVYLVFTRMPGESYCRRLRGCTSGGVCVPCIYTHARWELPSGLFQKPQWGYMKEHQWKHIWYDTTVNIKYKCIQQKETNGNKNENKIVRISKTRNNEKPEKDHRHRRLRGCTSGAVCVPCIYTHARWELPCSDDSGLRCCTRVTYFEC